MNRIASVVLVASALLSTAAAAQSSVVQAAVVSQLVTVNANGMTVAIPSNGGGGSVGGYLINSGATVTFTCASSFDNGRTFKTSISDSPCVITPSNATGAVSSGNTLALTANSNSFRISITSIPAGATHVELLSSGFSAGTSVVILSSAGGSAISGGGGGGGGGSTEVDGTTADGFTAPNGVVIAGKDTSGNTLTVGASGAGTPANSNLLGVYGVDGAGDAEPLGISGNGAAAPFFTLQVGGTDGHGNSQPIGVGLTYDLLPATATLVGGSFSGDSSELVPISVDSTGAVNVNIASGSVSISGNIFTQPTTVASAHLWGQVTVGTSATLVLDVNPNRIGGTLQNADTVPISCGFDSSLTLPGGFVLAGGLVAQDGNGASTPLQPGYGGQIYCSVATGSATLFVSDF